MNEPVVATTHSSSSSACGSTAVTTPFSKIAGASSLAAAVAASQSFLAVFPAAAPDPQLGVSSAAAATAAEGRPGAAAAAAALPTVAGALPTAAAAASPTAAAALPETAAALARRRKEVVGMIPESSCCTSEDVDSRSSRPGRSGGGGCAEGLMGRGSGASLLISSLVVGAEAAAAAEEGRKGVAGGAAGGDCGEGSDCSTRSCASRSALPLMKEAAHSSDEDTRTRSDRQSRCSHSSRRRTGEEADCGKISCSNAFIVFRGERQLPTEDECRVNTRSSSTAGEGVAAETDRRRKHSERRRGHSRRRDIREGSSRHRQDRAVAPEQQEEEEKNPSGSGLAASRQKQPGAEGQRRRRGTAELYEKGPILPPEDSCCAPLADFSASDKGVNPEEERITAPDVLTLRRGRENAQEADVTGRAAAAVFCVASSVSAVAVGRSAVLGERGEGGAFAGAEEGGYTSSRKTPVPEDYRCVASKKREGAEERGEAAEGENPASRYAASSSCSGKSLGTREAAVSEAKVGRAGGVRAASEYSVKLQDPSYGYIVDALSVGGSVEALPCSSTGDGDSSLASTDTAAAVAAEKTPGDRVGENTSSRRLSEEVKKVGRKRKAGGGGEFFAAANQGIYRSGVSATATADRAPGQISRGASSSKAADTRVAATPAARRHEQAVAAAADLQNRHLLGDSSFTSNANGTSSTGGRRAAAAAAAIAYEGGGGGGGRRAARGGKKGGGSDAAVGLSQGKRGDSDRRAVGGKGSIIREDSASCSRSGRYSGSSRRTLRGASGSEMAAGEKGGRPGGLLLCAAGPGGGGCAAGVGGDLKSAAGCVGSMRGSEFCYNSRNAGTANVGRAATVMNRPTRVEAGRQRFLILDAPSDENLPAYIDEMKAFNVTHLVRTCEATYDDALVRQAGICTHEWVFPDGEPPPEEVIDEWLTLCNSVAAQQRPAAIAVHCVAGLGRAPVLVAVALIEKGMDPMDAIMFIRERRKGAINRRQLQFLKSYRRRSHMQRCCIGGCRLM